MVLLGAKGTNSHMFLASKAVIFASNAYGKLWLAMTSLVDLGIDKESKEDIKEK